MLVLQKGLLFVKRIVYRERDIQRSAFRTCSDECISYLKFAHSFIQAPGGLVLCDMEIFQAHTMLKFLKYCESK
jgi:hypothetical protein